MSMHYHLNRPKVTGGAPNMLAKRGRLHARTSQRDLVVASLVRCPEHRFSATGRKGG
jgi:hypothetical protein